MMNEAAEASHAGRFERVVIPHLDAAYNLARWLARNTHDAEDIVQESFLRAFRFFAGFQGGDPRAWLLKIVRNTTYSFLQRNRPGMLAEEFDETVHAPKNHSPDAEAALLQSDEAGMLREALADLPVNLREALVLRELEGMSYKEIAELMQVPIGTVMSSLARGRAKLRGILLREGNGPGSICRV